MPGTSLLPDLNIRINGSDLPEAAQRDIYIVKDRRLPANIREIIGT